MVTLTPGRDALLDEIAELIEQGELAVCAPFLLEAGWSARGAARDHELLELTALACESHWLAPAGAL